MLKIILLFFSTLFSAVFVSTVFNIINIDSLLDFLGLSEVTGNIFKLIINRLQEVTFNIINSVIYVTNSMVGNEISK